jgi:hypothetical protein
MEGMYCVPDSFQTKITPVGEKSVSQEEITVVTLEACVPSETRECADAAEVEAFFKGSFMVGVTRHNFIAVKEQYDSVKYNIRNFLRKPITGQITNNGIDLKWQIS